MIYQQLGILHLLKCSEVSLMFEKTGIKTLFENIFVVVEMVGLLLSRTSRLVSSTTERKETGLCPYNSIFEKKCNLLSSQKDVIIPLHVCILIKLLTTELWNELQDTATAAFPTTDTMLIINSTSKMRNPIRAADASFPCL